MDSAGCLACFLLALLLCMAYPTLDQRPQPCSVLFLISACISLLVSSKHHLCCCCYGITASTVLHDKSTVLYR
jgi:hypothetical protein